MVEVVTEREDITEWPQDAPAIVRIVCRLAVETTPLEAYSALTETTDADYAFLLESADKVDASDPDGAFRPSSARADKHARFSFVGYDPIAVARITADETVIDTFRDDPLVKQLGDTGDSVVDRLRSVLPEAQRIGFDTGERQLLEGGLVGYLAYDAVYDMWIEEVGCVRPDTAIPDAEFVVTTRTLTFDDLAGTCDLVCTPFVTNETDMDDVIATARKEAERVEGLLTSAEYSEPAGFDKQYERADPQAEYEQAVRQAKEHVLDGDIYQGVISREREIRGSVDPRQFYASLRAVNPSPYMYLLEFGNRSVVGASPETLVSVRGDLVTSNPIAGTCKRGQSPVEDRRLAGQMLADEKELAEHTMLVDLARNDVRRVSTPGSVRVDEFMSVLKYSHVQHIESTVTGTLAPEADAFDATRAAFPAGTLAGAPKIRAMELIDALESSPRGIYGGGVGYFSWTGDADMAITIRSATIEHGDEDRIFVRAGAGIVADSDPTAEYHETEAKMDAVLTALERIESTPNTGVQ